MSELSLQEKFIAIAGYEAATNTRQDLVAPDVGFVDHAVSDLGDAKATTTCTLDSDGLKKSWDISYEITTWDEDLYQSLQGGE